MMFIRPYLRSIFVFLFITFLIPLSALADLKVDVGIDSTAAVIPKSYGGLTQLSWGWGRFFEGTLELQGGSFIQRDVIPKQRSDISAASEGDTRDVNDPDSPLNNLADPTSRWKLISARVGIGARTNALKIFHPNFHEVSRLKYGRLFMTAPDGTSFRGWNIGVQSTVYYDATPVISPFIGAGMSVGSVYRADANDANDSLLRLPFRRFELFLGVSFKLQ